MDRAYARQNQYDCTTHHLLCVALRERARLTARGYHCVLFTETMCTQRFTLYFLYYKKLNQPTRRQRGL